MIAGIPRAPLILGLAGLIPFLWGAASVIWPGLAAWGLDALGSRFIGPYVQLFYGAVILSFMSGVLWGFATRTDGTMGYVLSVLPALWAFFMTGGGPTTAAANLVIGFIALLMIDWHFWTHEATPPWWMRLRVLLTVIVVTTYIPLIF
jgi:hypothetical protein